MNQRLDIPVANGDVARDGKQDQGSSGPIRKQSAAEPRAYMREHMRAYRLQHLGPSTPYVRKYRSRQRPKAT